MSLFGPGGGPSLRKIPATLVGELALSTSEERTHHEPKKPCGSGQHDVRIVTGGQNLAASFFFPLLERNVMKKGLGHERCSAPRLGNLFMLYLHNNVSESTRNRVEIHLGSCRPCRDEMEFLAAGLRGRQRMHFGAEPGDQPNSSHLGHLSDPALAP